MKTSYQPRRTLFVLHRTNRVAIAALPIFKRRPARGTMVGVLVVVPGALVETPVPLAYEILRSFQVKGLWRDER